MAFAQTGRVEPGYRLLHLALTCLIPLTAFLGDPALFALSLGLLVFESLTSGFHAAGYGDNEPTRRNAGRETGDVEPKFDLRRTTELLAITALALDFAAWDRLPEAHRLLSMVSGGVCAIIAIASAHLVAEPEVHLLLLEIALVTGPMSVLPILAALSLPSAIVILCAYVIIYSYLDFYAEPRAALREWERTLQTALNIRV